MITIHSFSKNLFYRAIIVLSLILFFTGCATDFTSIRKDHATEFTEDIISKSLRVLPSGIAQDLESCIKITLENNLDIKISEINKRLAGIDRNIAFGYFLPHIDVRFTHTKDNKLQMRNTGSSYMATSDQDMRVTVIEGQLAIFNPEVWFMYSAFKKGDDIEKLLALRVKQAIRLQVTALYLSSLSLESNVVALGSSVAQANALLMEMEALHREGFILKSDLKKARVFLMMQQNNLSEMERQKIYTKSQLLEVMGLSPLSDITLGEPPSLSIENNELPDIILTAMLNRPELMIADRSLAAQGDAVKMAISAFLPKILLIGDFTSNVDSFLKYRDIFTYGVSGILTIFEGFTNIQEYKAAKQEKLKTFLEREQACMKIMLEAIAAKQSLDREDDYRKLMKLELDASESRLKEVMSLWQEGMMTSSGKLEAASHHAMAKANMTMADYRYQLATATMTDVMGITGKE